MLASELPNVIAKRLIIEYGIYSFAGPYTAPNSDDIIDNMIHSYIVAYDLGDYLTPLEVITLATYCFEKVTDFMQAFYRTWMKQVAEPFDTLLFKGGGQ